MERLYRDTSQGILGQQAQALNTGFDSSMKNYLAGQGQSLSAAGTLGTLGQTQQQLAGKDVTALNAAGLEQQQQAQQGLNLGYQDFQNQVNYPQQMLGVAQSAINAGQVPQSSSTTSTGPLSNTMGASPLQQIAAMWTGASAVNKMPGQ